MSFVKLENLNDFIQPSTTCIKPLEKKSAGVVAKVSDINLSDCLACSGCITSAETVLVQQQNHEELFKVINDAKISKTKKEIVVSLSLQSVASLAHKYDITTQEAAGRIASFFISLGCDKVYDINIARHIALVESHREFKRRLHDGDKPKLPIISSICPGWICYAEKTNGDLIIPHLSKVRSPQQIMGSILKSIYANKYGKERSDIYHVTLMPCFDKKLEASRQDFKQIHGDETVSQDVDCVLTPVELEMILNDEGVTLLDLEPRKLDVFVKTGLEFDEPLSSHFGSASGGYAENILIAEASEILGHKVDKPHEHLKYTTLKNNDFIELTLASGDDPRCLRRFAIVNGFRNIQTVVQRLKRNVLKYDYIEIMACPSGCINGGAQCGPHNGEDKTACIEKTKLLYSETPQIKQNINNDEISNRIYSSVCLSNAKDVDELLYTNFHSVPKMQNLTVSW